MKKHDRCANSSALEQVSAEGFEKAAFKVSMVSIIGNTLLSLLKLFAGIFARSGAMISDAVHSASDVFSSVIVIVGVKISAKASDREHPYGHERFECVAAIILSAVLLISGLFIGHTAVEKMTSGTRDIAVPGLAALIAALVSISGKEAMYRYTAAYAKRFDSGALMADAWHHRSDALSSVGALAGIAGSRMGFPALDTIASLVICLFIVKAAYDIFTDAIDKMVDRSCSEYIEQEIAKCAAEQTGVLGVDLIHTRIFGSRVYVDIEIAADSRITLAESHEIASRVHNAIEEKFIKVKHVMVHVNPFKEDVDY